MPRNCKFKIQGLPVEMLNTVYILMTKPKCQLTTWHCSHLLLNAKAMKPLLTAKAGQAAINRHLLAARLTVANLLHQHAAVNGQDRQTDRQTDRRCTIT